MKLLYTILSLFLFCYLILPRSLWSMQPDDDPNFNQPAPPTEDHPSSVQKLPAPPRRMTRTRSQNLSVSFAARSDNLNVPPARIATPTFDKHPDEKELREYQDFVSRLRASKDTRKSLFDIAYTSNSLICNEQTIAYLTQKIDINEGYPGEPEYNALLIACRVGNERFTQILLNLKARTDICYKDTDTPLIISARNSRRGCVELLLEHGAQVNFVATASNTCALFWACIKGNTQMVELLLRKGARPELIKDVTIEEGGKKLFFKDSDDLANHLVKEGKKFHGVAKLLVEQGAQLSPQNKLRYAFRNGKEAIRN